MAAEVLPARIQGEASSHFSGPGLRRSKSSHTSLSLAASQSSSNFSADLKENAKPPSSKSKRSTQKRSRSPRTAKSTTSLRRSESDPNLVSSPTKERLSLAVYQKCHAAVDNEHNQAPPSSPQVASPPSDCPVSDEPSPSPSVDLHYQAEDDTAVKREPSRHVDYLSHEWLEEDIWMSWRLIVSKRREYGERSRLENASWRTWAQLKNKLDTVSPQTLNWMKDSDVTWLYGPLQTASQYTISNPPSEPLSRLSKTNSFLHKKPILKKRSMSEQMLQKSLSTSSLVRQAAAAVQAQQRRPSVPDRQHSEFVQIMPVVPSVFSPVGPSRDGTDYFSSQSTSGCPTPAEHGEKRHIRFDDKVEQCIAVDAKDGDFEEEEEDGRWHTYLDDEDDSSDEGVIMMKQSKKQRKRKSERGSSSRRNSGCDTKIIAKLPSTRLKYRTDSPDVPELPSHSLLASSPWRPSRLSPSPSVETLRPKDPSRNFLLPGDDMDEEDQLWATEVSDIGGVDEEDILKSAYADDRHEGMRRTASGMFVPIEEDDPAVGGLVGKVLDTVNTAKDIAHVIWNVGWRR